MKTLRAKTMWILNLISAVARCFLYAHYSTDSIRATNIKPLRGLVIHLIDYTKDLIHSMHFAPKCVRVI